VEALVRPTKYSFGEDMASELAEKHVEEIEF
jgi:hypothetical protein